MIVTSDWSVRARWPTSMRDVADLAGDRRGQLQPVGAHQAGPLLGERGALGEQHRAVAARLDQPLRALRLGIPERRALRDDALGEGFDVRPPREQGRACILDLTLAAGALPGQPGGAAHSRLGETDLVRGERALPFQRGDGSGEAGALLLERGGFRGADLRGQFDLPGQLGILVGQLLQLAADAVHALRERQRDQRLAGADDIAVADMELADFGGRRGIDAGDAGIISDDAANPRRGRIAAENEDRGHDRHDRRQREKYRAREDGGTAATTLPSSRSRLASITSARKSGAFMAPDTRIAEATALR